MGIGHEIWQVEGNMRAKVWAMDNIKLDIKKCECEASIRLRAVTVSGI
jgi:hypothetical protein